MIRNENDDLLWKSIAKPRLQRDRQSKLNKRRQLSTLRYQQLIPTDVVLNVVSLAQFQ